MDALYFRVSTDRQTTENQFEDLLQISWSKSASQGQASTCASSLEIRR